MTTPSPLAVIAVPPLQNEAIRNLLRTWDYTPVVASRHREASFRENGRSDPLMTRFMVDLFQKNNIHFISRYLPDSKRQQTTTVDYKRLINSLVLTRFASLQHNYKNIENG